MSKTDLLADGIYFGLSEKDYHSDAALGSSGLKKLINNAPDFWWNSSMNPAKEEEKDTPALIFGRQLHKCVLEGIEKFKSLYAPYFNSSATKAGKAEIAAIEGDGKEPVKIENYTKILAAAGFIKANKTLANAFEGGQPEVSVFWTDEKGVRFKARFDYLKLNAIVDLKSIANLYGKEFGKACQDSIASYDYLVSAAHYSEARRRMRNLHVYGDVDAGVNRVWLSKVMKNENFAFVFVFWQKTGAPISYGIQLSPQNPLFDYARAMIFHAVDNYRRFLREFGTENAWVPTTKIKELDESDLPVWYQQRLMYGE